VRVGNCSIGISGAVTLWMLGQLVKEPGFVRLTDGQTQNVATLPTGLR
jgi:hypothetical protein